LQIGKGAGQTGQGRWAGGRNEDLALSARVSGRCTNCLRFALVKGGFPPVKRGDVYAHEVGEMSARVSWQRLAVLRSQLTERDWEVMAMLKRVKLANGRQIGRAIRGATPPPGNGRHGGNWPGWWSGAWSSGWNADKAGWDAGATHGRMALV
jgi:hypothetical protein